MFEIKVSFYLLHVYIDIKTNNLPKGKLKVDYKFENVYKNIIEFPDL